MTRELPLVAVILLAAATLGAAAVSQRPVQTLLSPQGQFCVTLETSEPPGLLTQEQVYWSSQPEMSIQMYVTTLVLEVFVAEAARYRFGSGTLTPGQHNFAYSYGIGNRNEHLLTVHVDGIEQADTYQEAAYQGATYQGAAYQGATYRATDSNFTSVVVSAKGPLGFSWALPCTDASRAGGPAVLPSSPPTTGGPTAGAHLDHTGTPRYLVPTHLTEEQLEARRRTTTWVIISSCLLALALVVCLSTVFLHRHNKQKKVARRRHIAAEREKQRSIGDAKRLSHLEQVRWAESCVDEPLTNRR